MAQISSTSRADIRVDKGTIEIRDEPEPYPAKR